MICSVVILLLSVFKWNSRMTLVAAGMRISAAPRSSRYSEYKVEHVLGKLATGDTVETILSKYPFLEPANIQAYLIFTHRSVVGEHAKIASCIRLGITLKV